MEGHSPLGASGAYRWMRCPGSVTLSSGIVDQESDHAALGTAAHALGEYCLEIDLDAWEMIGHKIAGDQWFFPGEDVPANAFTVDKDMADAVQVYLDAVRKLHPDRNQGNAWIERPFHCPSIHEYCYGRSDFTYLDLPNKTLHVWDYKHGAGIVVEVQNNPQLMYYGAAMMEDLDLSWDDEVAEVDTITLHVAQPRGFHASGPIRSWSISRDELGHWVDFTLIPAMDRALASRDTNSGEHCRFCPSRTHACPQLAKDMEELQTMLNTIDKIGGAAALSDADIARYLDLFDKAKMVARAASETAFARMNAGRAIPGWKLAKSRANRVWRETAEAAVAKKFGDDAFTEPKLKSPAQIDELPEGKKLTAEHAYSPPAGLTVVKADDTRPEVSRSTKSLFQPVPKGKK